ncbi:MAG: CDP-alcohol phosphatidyltransferase family protein [Leptospiraceae bacterium]|nr:CDP-alcohol phosphatidyltransferase family protein [Leptospiraceae bacterium]MCP5497376.1 CDP-alcohol phosphatidyltransferase family protein [Leptospiraceae bacterium]
MDTSLIKKKIKELTDEKIFTISNFLSLSRVFLLPIFIYYSKEYVKSPLKFDRIFILFGICFLAVLTDYFDGFFARLLHQETILGRYLDPICDKIVTIGGLGVIVKYFHFPLWVLIIYIVREILGIWLGGFLFIKRNIQGKPNWWGKIGVATVALSVVWYMSMPLIAYYYPSESFLHHPEISAYILLFIIIGGVSAYSKRYWNIVFHPEKV